VSPDDVRASARVWIAQDPDPVTRGELGELLARDDRAELNRRFGRSLTFGTAGLRGALGAGPNRMNRVVVCRAARGLADYLLTEQDAPSAVIGYDHRHSSERFARDTAEIMAGAGVSAVLLPTPAPTPVLAFAIRRLGCAAGIMVTASHNPAGDSGYKVYLGDSSQIAAPADAAVAVAIAAVGRVDRLPRDHRYRIAESQLVEAYLDAAAGVLDPHRSSCGRLSVVYTPLHGVGGAPFLAALARGGFPPPHVVAAQAEPDPDFPTAPFPNPEEPDALRLALAEASRRRADLVIAHDPDADRCLAAVRRGDDHQVLTGDQLGALLADHLLRRGVTGCFASSIVSSSLLPEIAASYGQRSVRTLTGFKWIGKTPDLAFGYEEALGYCVAPAIARDKDGITAALLTLELAESLAATGSTLSDRLHALYREHGWHATGQVSVRFDGQTAAGEALNAWRADPPSSIGSHSVTAFDDLARGHQGLPPTDGLRFQLGDDAWLICRPSGTEPKLKCYLEIVLKPATPPEQAEREAVARLNELRSAARAALTDIAAR